MNQSQSEDHLKVIFAFDLTRGRRRGRLGGPLRLDGAVPLGERVEHEVVGGGVVHRHLGPAERLGEFPDLCGPECLLKSRQRYQRRALLLRRGAARLCREPLTSAARALALRNARRKLRRVPLSRATLSVERRLLIHRIWR